MQVEAGETETELIVRAGSYSAAMGNGILVSGGTVTIDGGEFSGADSYRATNGNLMPGAAASYAFKMYGGEVTVNGGTFESEGSGAFIMGTAADAIAKAKIRMVPLRRAERLRCPCTDMRP